MFEWIVNNYEWIFSGIGVLFLTTIAFFIKKRNTIYNEHIKQVAQRYVDMLDGKIHGYHNIPGLVLSGAAKLKSNKQLLKVCSKIEEYGKPDPLKMWVLKHINKKELLQFVKWNHVNDIEYSPHYFNEENFIKLVEEYNKSKLNQRK